MWCWRGWGLRQAQQLAGFAKLNRGWNMKQKPVEQISLFQRASGCFWLICEIVRNSEIIWQKSVVGSPEISWGLYILRQVVEESFPGWSESRHSFFRTLLYLFQDHSVFIFFACLKHLCFLSRGSNRWWTTFCCKTQYLRARLERNKIYCHNSYLDVVSHIAQKLVGVQNKAGRLEPLY